MDEGGNTETIGTPTGYRQTNGHRRMVQEVGLCNRVYFEESGLVVNRYGIVYLTGNIMSLNSGQKRSIVDLPEFQLMNFRDPESKEITFCLYKRGFTTTS